MEKEEAKPTAIFSVERKKYIVKSRIIYNLKTRRMSKGKIWI